MKKILLILILITSVVLCRAQEGIIGGTDDFIYPNLIDTTDINKPNFIALIESYSNSGDTFPTEGYSVDGTAIILTDGSIRFPHLSDTAAQNDSDYYSTTQNKRCYKDSGGTVHPYY